MGGGEKACAVVPFFNKLGVRENMPEGVGASAVNRALGDKFSIGGGLAERETVKDPAEKLKTSAGWRYPLQYLG
jgi:hypothetical protein